MLIKTQRYIILGEIALSKTKANLIIITKTHIIKIPLFNFWIKQISKEKWSIVFVNKHLYKNFITLIFDRYNIFKCLYFYKLYLKGLGFRIVKYTEDLFRFFYNKINYIYLYVPLNIIMNYKERKLIFLSFNWDILKIVIGHILLLKKLSIYNTRGLYFPRQIRILKPGKKRF